MSMKQKEKDTKTQCKRILRYYAFSLPFVEFFGAEEPVSCSAAAISANEHTQLVSEGVNDFMTYDYQILTLRKRPHRQSSIEWSGLQTMNSTQRVSHRAWEQEQEA